MEKQELHIDFEAAKAAFETYLDEYDRTDDKIHLKIVHTYCVVDCAEEIAIRMHLGQEDVQLAKIIGLLHDIGRFEQIRRFHSFEPGTMDHAAYGAELLFGPEKMIRRFVKEDTFDKLIETAIAKHSDFRLEGISDAHTLLHARLIRDADKLDNCRVKLEETMETLLDMDEATVGASPISEKVCPVWRENPCFLRTAYRGWITGCHTWHCILISISRKPGRSSGRIIISTGLQPEYRTAGKIQKKRSLIWWQLCISG